MSKLFYTPNVANMAALKSTSFDVPPGFPTGLLPAQDPQDRKLVINAGGDSVQCVFRNVNTFKKAEPGVGIAEVRGTNMKDAAQGGGVALRPNADGDDNPDNDPKAAIYGVPFAVGTPDQVIENLRAYRDLPMDEMSIQFHPPGMDPRAVEASMRLFAAELMPEISTWGS